MSRRTKTPGWAAFDPNKQPKQVTTDKDPYPPISTNNTALRQYENASGYGDRTGKSFFSVLTDSSDGPDWEGIQTPVTGNSRRESNAKLYEKLKVDHSWANETLIEDIVAAVDNDIDKASILLKEMAPRERLQDKEVEVDDEIEEVGVTARNDERLDEHNVYGKVVLNGNVPSGFMIDLSMIPVEPEWEEDDMYLTHRRPAIRAMRLASHHSKAASEAYLRRDHAAAQEHSIKARKEWSKAEKLNANAAMEILAIRNCENDDWKLDLHGLHVTEAVQVLQEHLMKIESQLSHSTKPDKTNIKVSLEAAKSDRQQHLSKPRLLEVITGKGSHSRGEAALPVAIKSFLSEKGYYYYEARIGVITVQPKFRQLSNAIAVTE